MAIMDHIWALIGHFAGTNIGYMGIYCHICIRIVPPYWRGDLRGLSPRNSLLLHKRVFATARHLRALAGVLLYCELSPPN